MPSEDTANKTTGRPRKKRWLKRLALIGMLLFVAVLAIGWYAKSLVRREVIKLLKKGNIGQVEVGDVSIGLKGIRIFDVRLIPEGATEPKVVIGKLSVNAPLSRLMSSTPTIDSIEMEQVDMNWQFDANGKLLYPSPSDALFKLPASSVIIRHGTLTITQPGHDTLMVDGIELTVSGEEGARKMQGNIGDFAGASWNLSGSHQAQQDTVVFNIATDSVAFDSNTLSRWPLVPRAMVEHFEFAGKTAVSIDMEPKEPGKFAYQAELTTENCDLHIRAFDLQMQPKYVALQFKEGKLKVTDLLVHVDGGELHVTGDADFAAAPITGGFAVELQQIPVATLRHLAPIPKVAEGFATGEATGSFTIGGESTFAMQLSAKGQGSQTTYEGFVSEGTQVGVEIESLKLNDKFRLRELAGTVKVDTTVSHLAVDKFLDRFHIKPEGAAPKIVGDAKAQVDLLIPLATAADVGSWSLTVNAASEEVSLYSELLRDVSASFGIEAGMLTFHKLTGKASHGGSDSDPSAENGRVSMTGKWPFVQDRVASFEIKGTEVSVEWLMGIAKDYSADVEQVLKMIDPDFETESSSLGGNLTVTVKVEFPPAAAKDFSKWTITGEVTAGEISIDERSIENIKSRFKLADRLFTLENLDGELSGGGTISISGSVPLESKQEDKVDVSLDQAPAKFDVTWQRVPIAFLSDLAGISPQSLGGNVSGKLHIERSIALAEKPAIWSAAGEISGSQLVAGEIALADIRFRIATEKGLISATDFQYGQDPIGFDLLASISVSAPYDYKFGVELKDFDLSRLAKIDALTAAIDPYLPLDGIAQFNGQLSGTLQPFAIATSGTASITDLEIAKRRIDDIAGRWEFNSAELEKAEAKLDVFGGTIQLAKLTTDPALILAKIENLDAEQIAAIVDLPGRLSGKLSGTFAIDSWTSAETRKTVLQLAGVSAVAGPLNLSELTGELTYGNKQLNYRLEGKLLAGQFSVTGETNMPADGWENIKIPLACKLSDANLNQLSRESQALAGLNNLNGAADASFDLNINGPEFQPEGSGKASMRDVTWKSELLMPTVSAFIAFKDNYLNVREFRADVGGGEISGQASYSLSATQPGSYELTVRRVGLATALIFWPAIAEDASGYFDARIAGTLDRDLTGVGQIAVERGSLYSLAEQSLRLPIQFQLNMQDFNGRVEVRQTTFRILDGTVSAKASLEFGNRINLDADASLTDVDSGELIGMLTNSRDYDQGELSGKLTLKGRSVRSVRDLQGSFRGSLMRSQSFKLPLLDDIGAFLASGRLTQGTFDSDVIDLQLANGIVKVNKFTFASDFAQVLITGNVSTDKRLDLEVVAQIADLNANPLVQRLVNSPLSRLQPAPTAIATEFARLVSNRLIYLHVGGTTRSPSFQLRTGLLLRDEVIQFFIQNAQIPGLSDIRNIPQNR